MSKIEELEAQLKKLQEELDKLRKKESEKKYPAILPLKGEYYLDNEFNAYPIGWEQDACTDPSTDQNVFPDMQTAEDYAHAFCVMLALRRCEGSGCFLTEYGQQIGYYYSFGARSIEREEFYPSETCVLFPVFPSEELATAALEAVGEENVNRAYRTLLGIKESV